MTMHLRRSLCLIAVGVFHLAVAAGAAPENAPLPTGYPADAAGTEYVNGLFVYATYKNWGFSAASDRVIKATGPCRDKSRQPVGLEQPQVFGNEEHWLYRTDTEVILFTRTYDARIDLEMCRFEPVEVRTVTRFPVTSGVLEWPSRFDGEALTCGQKEVCKRRRIVGMLARCRVISARYVGSTDCVSISRPTLGMTLTSSIWSDDGQFADFKVVSIRVNARLDRAVFTSPDRWKPDAG